jgi:cytochrome P450
MAGPTFEFMPFGGDVTGEPYPVYARMREAGPLLRTPFGAYLVHRYDDVRRVHMDHAHFSMSMGGMGAAMAGRTRPRSSEGGMGVRDFMLGQTMLTADPHDHEGVRRVVQAAFTPGSITRLLGLAGLDFGLVSTEWPGGPAWILAKKPSRKTRTHLQGFAPALMGTISKD